MERLEYFSQYFIDCKNVLDVGCGTGAFLEIMKRKGITASGVDLDRGVVELCGKEGLSVVCADALSFLQEKSAVYDGIMVSNLVEHLQPAQFKELLEKGFRSLIPGGIMLVAVPDPKDIKTIAGEFWEDVTHVRLYPLGVLDRMFKAAGFTVEKLAEKKKDYPKLLWKLRDVFRNVLVGPFWGRSEIYVLGRKKV